MATAAELRARRDALTAVALRIEDTRAHLSDVLARLSAAANPELRHAA